MQKSNYIPALKYRWLTPYYDIVVGLTTREPTFKTALIEQAGIGPGQRVLDLACGTGTLALWLKAGKPDTQVHGVDGDPQILDLAAAKAARGGADVSFVNAMSQSLPFSDESFDRVLSSLFFHHLDTHEKELTAREVLRVLKPGGELHIADWGRAANPAMRLMFVPVQLLDGISNTRDNIKGRIPAILEQAGLVNVAQTRTFSTVLGTLSLYKAARPS